MDLIAVIIDFGHSFAEDVDDDEGSHARRVTEALVDLAMNNMVSLYHDPGRDIDTLTSVLRERVAERWPNLPPEQAAIFQFAWMDAYECVYDRRRAGPPKGRYVHRATGDWLTGMTAAANMVDVLASSGVLEIGELVYEQRPAPPVACPASPPYVPFDPAADDAANAGAVESAKTTCDQCGKVLARSSLARHRRHFHGKEKKAARILRCQHPGCGKVFDRQDNLTRHQSKHAVHTCAVCAATFRRNADLGRHQHSHQVESLRQQLDLSQSINDTLQEQLDRTHADRQSGRQ